eukprot:1159954-Pelagomonas_calceolata.AAC.6
MLACTCLPNASSAPHQIQASQCASRIMAPMREATRTILAAFNRSKMRKILREWQRQLVSMYGNSNERSPCAALVAFNGPGCTEI